MIDAYLHRLGLSRELPSVPYLFALHSAHVSRIVYSNLGIMQGRPAGIDPMASVPEIIAGRGGYCFHLNGAFAWLLRELGFAVTLHRGFVIRRDIVDESAVALNHLVLLVHDLPDGSVWFVDAGLGDAIHEPLPLTPGVYRQGPFSYELAAAAHRDGWRFTHDVTGSFAAMEFESAGATPADFEEAHRFLSTSPESPFVKFLTVQARHDDGVEAVRGCLLTRVDAGGKRSRSLSTPEIWLETLARLGLDPSGVAELWPAEWAAHEQWMATA